MPADPKCGKCGTTLDARAPEGLCPACMLSTALDGALAPPDDTLLGLSVGGELPPGAPRLLGDYELLEEVARGGMGVVFKARQIGLNRVVALKMLLGGQFASPERMGRFRSEAQTSARLHHPNIVAIHEVGEHEGQPFFSMDYVEGQNLAQLVGSTPLPAKRAAMYLKAVAEAVQYAHSQGVLHRDLKPSNVLIDLATDQPRVTDFGLAKRMEDDPSLTITGQILGSPSFISPEQAAGKKEVLGPAGDVYSLGALLYHLVTARPPFVADTMAATLRLVAEQEPVSPRLLNASVPRDLETMCLKCLQKEQTRRYASARDVAEELDRFLRDETILARPVSQFEKAWRWCQRKPALAVAILLVFVVAIGSPVAAILINRERMEAETDRRKAQTEAARSHQVAQFLKDMLGGVGPSVALGRDKTLLQEILDRTADRIGRDLKDEPEVEADLRNTLGEVYYAIGQDEKAEAMHRAAIDLRTRIFGEQTLLVAESQHNLGLALYARAEPTEAVKLLQEALATRKKLLGSENLTVGESLNSLGLALFESDQGKWPEAEALFREALSLRRKLLPDEHPDLALSLQNLANTLSSEGKHTEAEALAREALAMQRKLLGNQHPNVAVSLYRLASVLLNEGDFAQSEAIQREGVAMQRKLLGSKHPDLAKSLWILAQALAAQSKYSEAEAVGREGLAMLGQLFNADHPALYWPSLTLAQILGAEGKVLEAETLYRETLARARASSCKDSWLLSSLFNSLAYQLSGQGRLAEAESLYREGLPIASRVPASSPQGATAWAWSFYGMVYASFHQGKLQEADRLYRQAMQTNALAWLKYQAACELSIDLLAAQGKDREAEDFFTNALAQTMLDKSASLHRTRGNFRASRGHWNKAAEDFTRALELEPENVENYHRLSALLVQTGQLDAYHRICGLALERFAATRTPGVAERVAKDSLILPASGEMLEAASRMADIAVSEGRTHPGTNWIRITKGLAEYRQGHWASSIEWAERGLKSPGVVQRDAEGYLVQAMARQQLGQIDAARETLAKALEIVNTKLPRLEAGDLGGLWNDWIIDQLLLKEAIALIGGIKAVDTLAEQREN